MFNQITQIITGHVNELLNLEQKLYNERKPICNKCKLKIKIKIMDTHTEICNPNLYLNPETNEIIDYPKEGFKNGCGCRLEASTRTKDKICPLGKW
jgi:hypothetical protein